jgi:hypothetical protein
MNQEYKDLLELEKWYELFSTNDRERLQEEMMGLQDALAELKAEELNMDESGYTGRSENQKEEQDYYVGGGEKKVDLNLFGINFTELENTTKYALGLSLIFMIFAAVVYGLYWIKTLNKKEVKKKKKSK